MTDVCNLANRIGTYAPSSSSAVNVNLLSKNVDAVTVEANLVACDALTIGGVPITTVSAEKVQNITAATPAQTTFNGQVTMTDLSTTQIETDTIIPKTGTSLTITDAGVANPTLTIIPSTGRIGVNYTTPQNTIDVRSSTTATVPSFLVDAFNSRIGIGLTSPSYPIHVSSPSTSTVALAGFLAPSLPVSANASIFVGTSTSNLAALRYITSATNTTATNQLALSVGSTNIMTSTNSATNFPMPVTIANNLTVTGTSNLNLAVNGQNNWTRDTNSTYIECACPFARSVTFGFQDMYFTGITASTAFTCRILTSTGTADCSGVRTVGTNGGTGRAGSSDIFYLHNSGNQALTTRMSGSITLTRMYTATGSVFKYNIQGHTTLRDTGNATEYFSVIVGNITLPSSATLAKIRLQNTTSSTGQTGTEQLSYIL